MDGDLQRAVGDAVSTALQTVENGLLTRWVLLAESIDAEGGRGLWLVAPEDACAWDSIGMLTYALHMEQARVVKRELDGED